MTWLSCCRIQRKFSHSKGIFTDVNIKNCLQGFTGEVYVERNFLCPFVSPEEAEKDQLSSPNHVI